MGKYDSINSMIYFLIDVYASFLPGFGLVNTAYEMTKIDVCDLNFDNGCWVFRKFFIVD